MKFVEKKCPNCGAGLKFDDGATSVTCEYCNQTFYIQKDEKKYARVDDAHKADAYKFVNEIGKPIVKGIATAHIIMSIVPFVMFIIVFLGLGFTIFHFASSQINEVEDTNNKEESSDIFDMFEDNINKEELKVKYVTKLSEIDNITLETFYDAAKSNLHHMDNMDYTVGEWSPVGSYLLVSKDGKSNKLYTVMKHTYTGRYSNKKVTLYAAYLFNSLKLNDNNMVNHNFSGISVSQDIDLDGKTHNFADGYESVEKLYNHVLRNQVGDYTIEATEGLYLES